jgi:SAM-dependent methyltransferase
LHRVAPKQILDLGCGGGFFLFICRHYGHSVTGLDLDEFPLLRELTGLLQVPRVNWTIEPFQSLPDFGQKFDLITAFSTRFNRTGKTDSSGAWKNGVFSWTIYPVAWHLVARFSLRSIPGKTRAIIPTT